MFKAVVTTQIVTIVSLAGQTVPATKEERAPVGSQHVDREAAVKACEEHFSVLKSGLQEKVPDNPLISQSTLLWRGNYADPEIPLGIRGYDNPPSQMYEVSYVVSETA